MTMIDMPKSAAELRAGYRSAHARLMGVPARSIPPAPPLRLSFDPMPRDFANAGRFRFSGKRACAVIALHFNLRLAPFYRADHNRGSRRFHHIRQIMMYVCVRKGGWTQAHTARFLRCHHTTVLYGVHRVERLVVGDSDFAKLVASVIEKCHAARALA